MHRISHMLLGIAIGDAFGAAYEFLPGGRLAVEESFDFSHYKKHPSENYGHKAGMYTDDTQMSIAVARVLSSGKPFTKRNLAEMFVECFKNDPIDGYARGFQRFMEGVDSGEDFLKRIRPNSIRNGAAMRAVPIGLVPRLEHVVENAITNAEVTHDTPRGLASSVSVALMSHHAYYGLEEHLFEMVDHHVRKIDPETSNYLRDVEKMEGLVPEVLFGEENAYKGVPCDGMRTAGAVYYILKNFGESPSETLVQSVLLGGDTDSVASISLGIAGMKKGLYTLPRFLFDGLTNHVYGRDYLIHLGEKLGEKY